MVALVRDGEPLARERLMHVDAYDSTAVLNHEDTGDIVTAHHPFDSSTEPLRGRFYRNRQSV
jgi:hypothetical protein